MLAHLNSVKEDKSSHWSCEKEILFQDERDGVFSVLLGERHRRTREAWCICPLFSLGLTGSTAVCVSCAQAPEQLQWGGRGEWLTLSCVHTESPLPASE